MAGPVHISRALMSDLPMTNVGTNHNHSQHEHRMFPKEKGYELQVWNLTHLIIEHLGGFKHSQTYNVSVPSIKELCREYIQQTRDMKYPKTHL